MQAAKWRASNRPNYDVNEDLIYPYSELPYVGEYIVANCYNVNRQYQLVSNGSDKGCKIPNRIPVYDENMCDTSSYIRDRSVKLVTLMGAPIIDRCAKDIARIINPDVGSVVVFGFDTNSEDLRRLRQALSDVSLYYCPAYKLPDRLKGLTLFDRHVAYLSAGDIREELYNSVMRSSFDTAVEITRSLNENGGGSEIAALVKKLLDGGIKNTTTYAYKLWNSGERDIVTNYFPLAFKLLLNGDNIKIESNYYNMALKLDANVDYYNDRLGWGDKNDHSSRRVSWKMIPIWDGNRVVFTINNNEHNMFLKLDVNVDSIGDRKCWGSNPSNERRHTWTMDPVNFQGNLVFFITNREYGQALKLDANVDYYEDRLLWGNNGNVVSNPRYFGWLIKSW